MRAKFALNIELHEQKRRQTQTYELKIETHKYELKIELLTDDLTTSMQWW